MTDLAEFQHAVEAAKVQLGRYSVTLVTVSENGIPDDIGSGTCVDLDGRRGIFTAAHVVLKTPADRISIGLPISGGFNSYIRSVHLEGGKWDDLGLERDPIDVAFLELTDEGIQAISRSKEFLKNDRIEKGVSYRERQFLVYGTPRALLEEAAIAQEKLILRPICYATVPSKERPGETTIDDHILLEFPTEENIWTANGEPLDVHIPEEKKLVSDPGGFSGGGIWTMRSEKSVVWSPESIALVGIQTGWLENRRLLVGNQIQHAIAAATNAPKES